MNGVYHFVRSSRCTNLAFHNNGGKSEESYLGPKKKDIRRFLIHQDNDRACEGGETTAPDLIPLLWRGLKNQQRETPKVLKGI